MIAWDENKV